jgi:hypothetical protein
MVRSQLVYLARLEREQAKLAAAPRVLRDSSLGARIEQDLVVAHSFAMDNLASLVRMRLMRHVDELEDTARHLETLGRAYRCP